MKNNLMHVEKFLNIRHNETNHMISLLKDSKKLEAQLILKSAIILLLYNEIEGVYSQILTSLFDYVADNCSEFNSLHKKMQDLYLRYYSKKINDNSKELLNFYNNRNLVEIDYLEINKFLNLFSGNLDARAIKKISKSLGVTLSESCSGEKLLYVKNLRNKLAHGEVSFCEACRDITLKELIEISDDTYNFNKMTIGGFNEFINRQLFSTC